MSERALRRVARRGDGWLPLIVVPSYVDVDGLVAQRSQLDELARQDGRDPQAIDTVLRVNIDAGTSTERVADTVKEIHERTGIDHFMIDSMYDVGTVDGSSSTPGRFSSSWRRAEPASSWRAGTRRSACVGPVVRPGGAAQPRARGSDEVRSPEPRARGCAMTNSAASPGPVDHTATRPRASSRSADRSGAPRRLEHRPATCATAP